VFEKQVELACKLKKPLFLHERDAHDEMINVLKKYQDKLPPAVLHCFTGTVDQAKAYLDLGLYIGITGNYYLLPTQIAVTFVLNNLVSKEKIVFCSN
jgi:Tat protein secretion system quality control protein TatD with DNase activity